MKGNIAELLQARAATIPDVPAITETVRGRQRTLTFAELETASARAAGLLADSGLEPGDRVLVLQPMSAELYVALLAISRLGLVATVVDPSAGREHLERSCEMCAPRAFIGKDRAHLLRLLSPAVRRIPSKFSIGLPVPGAVSWKRTMQHPPLSEIQACELSTPALLTFTTGSTGVPKAAVRTHGFLLAQHRSLDRNLRLAGAGLSMMTLPIVVLANLVSGVSTLIPDGDLRRPGSVDPRPIVESMVRDQVEWAAGSPAFFERVERYCRDRKITLPDFQRVFVGGAPVFPRLLDDLQRVAPRADLVAVYGSTEAEPIAHVAHRDMSADDVERMMAGAGLLAGPPVPDIQLRIVPDRSGTPLGPWTEDEFASACLSPNEPGEIVVSGDHVLEGYLDGRGNEETKFTVQGTTWHRTGDAGYLDSRGRVWLLGRCSARIQDDRGMLYPFSAECAVSSCRGIRRSAVIAHQGRRMLVVEPEDGTPPDELQSVRETVAWAHIDELRVLRHIPVDRRHNAKIDYRRLYQVLHRQR